MAFAALNRRFPPMRHLALAAVFRVLRAAHRLERRWPILGIAGRRAVLFCWCNAAAALRDWRTNDGATLVPRRLAELDRWTHVAPEDIALRRADSPVVSVIVPTYGQLAVTTRCLASIQAHPPKVPIEVIVVDDAFPGPEAAALSSMRGIRLIRNEINLGFLRSCNAAARAARGTFVLFLNNDTQVREGWLDALLEIFADHPDAGIAGSKLIGADGRLQEAGGIIWNDGSGWNHGRGEHPDAARYNYRREADYCSGASILLRREVFLGAGGFDEQYAPAYCEDSDISFRLRTRGLKTWYQPRSEVVHLEGVSHGRDIRRGVKSYQVANHAKFLRTWRDELIRTHFPNGCHVLRAADRARDRLVVLIVDHLVPEPDRDAGSRTMTDFMRALLSIGAVVKFWPLNLHRTPVYTEALQDLGIEVFHGPDQLAMPGWLAEHGEDLDLVLVSRPDVADLCLPILRAGTAARIAYYGHDLHFRRMGQQAEIAGDAAMARAADTMRAREMAIWRAADLVLYPSEEEAAIVRGLEPGATVHAVTPYALSGSYEPVPPPVPIIAFVAGFGHPPNRDAAIWFVREVLPLVLMRVPDAHLSIVGSNPVAAVRALRGPHVSLTANVTDTELAAVYARTRVAVVPLLAGAGVKRKTVEALWYGVPAVLTRVGAQGLPDIETIVPVTGDAENFAAAVCRLLVDDGLWRHQSAAQLDYARTRFSEAASRRSLFHALQLTEPAAPAQAVVSQAVVSQAVVSQACPRTAAMA